MTKVSGSFSGKAVWQASVSLKDQPNHDMILGEIAGPQKSSDEKWNNAAVTYWNTIDLLSGNGPQRGYFINVRPDGESDRGSFEGKVTTTGAEVRLEGTWKYTGGTGKFSGITGNGTYRGRMVSPTQVEMTWEGEYQLAGTKSAN